MRDYYPLWQVRIPYHHITFPRLTFSQLVYQTTVFLSRSSISLGLPPLPEKLLPLPAITQGIILSLLVFESAVGFAADDFEATNIAIVFALISLEGICGGLA